MTDDTPGPDETVTPKSGGISPRDLPFPIMGLPRQKFHGRARHGNIVAIGDTVIYVGPPVDSAAGTRRPPVLRYGRRGEEWKTAAVFPNATTADDFIHALETGLHEQAIAGEQVHNSQQSED